MEKPKHFFAAFIMTYERPEILAKTLKKIQEQTFPPEHILIVDNSETGKTEAYINSIGTPTVEYLRVGYNSGPAGAARIGLKKLSEMGYQWIYWGDDDNPPRDQFEFEQLIGKLGGLVDKGLKIGAVSGKGGRFNTISGRIRSLSNYELKKAAVMEVDSVPGGHTLIVNADVIKAGILPDEKLFFGFEDLEFSLRARRSGFRLFVDAENWLSVRIKARNNNSKFRPVGSGFGKASQLQRDYYSTRNLLYIFFKNNYYSAFAFTLVKSIVKSGIGFKFGLSYGFGNFRCQWRAVLDFFMNKSGRR